MPKKKLWWGISRDYQLKKMSNLAKKGVYKPQNLSLEVQKFENVYVC